MTRTNCVFRNYMMNLTSDWTSISALTRPIVLGTETKMQTFLPPAAPPPGSLHHPGWADGARTTNDLGNLRPLAVRAQTGPLRSLSIFARYAFYRLSLNYRHTALATGVFRSPSVVYWNPYTCRAEQHFCRHHQHPRWDQKMRGYRFGSTLKLRRSYHD